MIARRALLGTSRLAAVSRQLFRQDGFVDPVPVVEEWAVKRKVSHKLLGKDRHFIDLMRVQVEGGRGGDGCIAFLREAGRPKGPPAGGHGGRGGSVIFVASGDMSTLRGTRSKYLAPAGQHGQGKMMHGRNAEDLIVKVPVGTVVTEIAPEPVVEDEDEGIELSDSDEPRLRFASDEAVGRQGEREDILERLKRKNPDELLTRDLLPQAIPVTDRLVLHFDEPGQAHVVALGGTGGSGNVSFSSTHKSPKQRSLGRPGQFRTLQLELKTIADIGLIGLPNAGKSSLLNAISNASSRVADYPFTTLNPFLGTITWPDAARSTVADIPGLVRGAHRNVGLGHDFLRHVERSRVFVFVVDLADKPVDAMVTLLQELEEYRPGLARRPAIVVGNKADVVPHAIKGLEELRQWLATKQYEKHWAPNEGAAPPVPLWNVVPMSAKYKANVHSLFVNLRHLVDISQPQRLQAQDDQL
ncbi:obg family GTPase CgtA [Allomyces macrogynus ATCC 38327]|uniref:Obg family GTPase CgtA n=1 Tax=Allomyces macrogynus (strain ATCC 38327) TaxID=578462 RepID=A0A0L0SU75_ALLM3|nr:obg family GTPase CgtA [Allomyces macrogynus ATCC 38327]|eukprot:KNE66118.1 obg family GTPase CgtA [Allomyces macrogynus ATCC 38327]